MKSGNIRPSLDPGDGFAQAAKTLRAKAETEVDPAAKASYMQTAAKYEEINARAYRVFADAEQAIASAEDLSQSLLRKRRFSHRTWEFWVILAVAIGTAVVLIYGK